MSVIDETGEMATGLTITILEGPLDPHDRGCSDPQYPGWDTFGRYCIWGDGGHIDGLYRTVRVRIEKDGYETVTREFRFKSGYCHVSHVSGRLTVHLTPI